MNSFLILFCNTTDGMKIFSFLGKIFDIIMIIIPIILILMGTIDFVKAVISQKEDDMKKAQNTFIKRIIYGVIIFFVPAITTFLIGLIGEETNSPCMTCFNKPEECTIVDTPQEETTETNDIEEIIENVEESISGTGVK